MTNPEEEENITDEEIEDYLAELSEETPESMEKQAKQVDAEGDMWENMSDEEFEKEAKRQGITPYELSKRGMHYGLKNFRRAMRRMEIGRELMKRQLKEQPELAQDPQFAADMQYLEEELSDHKKALKVMEEEMRRLE
jgi:hypothetical protein